MKLERKKKNVVSVGANLVLASVRQQYGGKPRSDETIIVKETAAHLSKLLRFGWVQPMLQTAVTDVVKHLPSVADVELSCQQLGGGAFRPVTHTEVPVDAVSLRSAVLNQCLSLLDYIPRNGMPTTVPKICSRRGLVESNIKEHYWWSSVIADCGSISAAVGSKRSYSTSTSSSSLSSTTQQQCSSLHALVSPEQFCSVETRKKLKHAELLAQSAMSDVARQPHPHPHSYPRPRPHPLITTDQVGARTLVDAARAAPSTSSDTTMVVDGALERYSALCGLMDAARSSNIARVRGVRMPQGADSAPTGPAMAGAGPVPVSAAGEQQWHDDQEQEDMDGYASVDYVPLLHSILHLQAQSGAGPGGASERRPLCCWHYFDPSAWDALAVIVDETVSGTLTESAERMQALAGMGGTALVDDDRNNRGSGSDAANDISQFMSHAVRTLDMGGKGGVVDRFLSTDPVSARWRGTATTPAERTSTQIAGVRVAVERPFHVLKAARGVEARLVAHAVGIVDRKCRLLFGSDYHVTTRDPAGVSVALTNEQSITANLYVFHNIKLLVRKWRKQYCGEEQRQ